MLSQTKLDEFYQNLKTHILLIINSKDSQDARKVKLKNIIDDIKKINGLNQVPNQALQKGIKHGNEKQNHIANKCIFLLQLLILLSKEFPSEFDCGNLPRFNEFYDEIKQLTNNDSKQSNNDIISKLFDISSNIFKSANQIINLISLIKHFTRLYHLIIKKVTQTIDHTYRQMQNRTAETDITRFFVDKEGQFLSEIKNSEDIVLIFTNILDEYNKITCTDLQTVEGQYDLRKYFKDQIYKISSELSQIIEEIRTKKKPIQDILTSILSKLSEIPDNIQIKYKSLNNDLMNILLISKFREIRSPEAIIRDIDSIIGMYSPYFAGNLRKDFFDEFERLFGHTNKNNLLEGSYLLDQFLQFMLKKLLDHSHLLPAYKKLTKNRFGNYKTISKKDNFNDHDTLYELVIGKNMNFCLRKQYSDSNDIEMIDREMRILSSHISKFIVHTNDNTERDEIIFPHFPLGTLKSLYSSDDRTKYVKFYFVDKIVIILELAMALKDLHSKNEYHGFLCSNSVFISANNNAYLGGFYHGRNNDSSSTKVPILFYYYPPEKFSSPTNEESSAIKIDVFSFGVLMHEIITEISPWIRMKKMNQITRTDTQVNKLSEFLFSDQNSELFNVIDEHGDALIGLKEIIERCLKKESKDRYSSFEELIEEIKSIPIYEKNKEEIEFRINNATNAFDYECTISDLVESFYRGNQSSKEDIEILLSDFKKDDSYVFYDDIIEIILDTFDYIEIGDFLNSIHYKAKHKLPIKASLLIKRINIIVNNYTHNDDFIVNDSIYNEFINFIEENEIVPLNTKEAKKQSTELFEEAIKTLEEKGKSFYIDLLPDIILRKVINQIDKITSEVEEDILVREILNLNDICSSCKLFINRDVNFFIEKTYHPNVKQEVIDREKRILNGGYSKFIVFPIRIISYKAPLKLFIPYFPLGDIDSLVLDLRQIENEKKVKLSLVDKIVIITEIAMAMRDLHSHDEYHGNLSSQSVFINSKLDGYIGSICYDRLLETDVTKPRAPFYYRSPEILSNENYIKSYDNDYEEHIRLEQKNDIYSFGVLVHEIFTNVSLERRFGKRYRQTRLKILKGTDDKYKGYFNFLLKEGDGNEIFDEIPELKDFIEKCMKTESDERYSSFNEMIDSIQALPIYEQNKEEIEFRIKNAIDSRVYNCTLLDIVESYYRGQQSLKSDIQQFISEYCTVQNCKPFEFRDDIIQDIKMLSYHNIISIIEQVTNLLESVRNQNNRDPTFYKETISLILRESEQFIGKIECSQILYEFMEDKTIKKFNQNKDNGQFYYLPVLVDKILDHLVSKYLFLNNFHKMMNSDQNGSTNELLHIKDNLNMNDINSSSKIYYNDEMNIFEEKTYNSNVSQRLIDKEIRILDPVPEHPKFIACLKHLDKGNQFNKNKLIIPFFPFGNYDSLIYKTSQKPDNNNNLKLSSVDKIVIITEIAMAMRDLHSLDEYHGNLSSQSVFINSKLDGYIGSICYDRLLETDATKPRGPFYYRSPEILSNENSTESKKSKDKDDDDYIETEEHIKQEQNNDIYSFGVLVHEIFTDVSPESRFGNRPRQTRLNILKGTDDKYKGYFNFLLKEGGKNEIFDDIPELKDFIEKCMKTEPDERYQSFKEIIDSIQALPIYEQNKEEIEFRIENATNSSEYECTISDLVKCYCLGHGQSRENIIHFICSLNSLANQDITEIDQTEDIIKGLYKFFKVKAGDDYSVFFSSIFDSLIQQIYRYKNKGPMIINENDYLYSLSREMNANEEEETDFIIPVCSLGSFIQNNKYSYSDYSLIWLYFIAKDLSSIHSHNLYHGHISLDNIGLYYNHETNTLIPSVILYYCTLNINNEIVPSLLAKYQRKDIKQFIKLAKQIDGIHDNVIKTIEQCDSMNVILFQLFNYIHNYSNESQQKIFFKNHNNQDYSSYQITYPIIIDIFNLFIVEKYSMSELAINFHSIYQAILTFIENVLDNPELPIIQNFPQISTILSYFDQDQETIEGLISSIKNKSLILYKVIKDKEPKSDVEFDLSIEFTDNEIIIKHINDKNSSQQQQQEIKVRFESNINLADFSAPKKTIYDRKIENLPLKEVFRYIEFAGLYKRSVGFLLKRYIYNLNPKFRYRITIKLNNQKYLDTQDQSITLNEIKRITRKIDRLRKEPEAQDGNIVVLIDSVKKDDNNNNNNNNNNN
ncbi:hypothetical protein M9Y10_035878 [Tritrichomonas musculus]|uniref:Protein kinase domain-containing protein n=1 Tax=Tritrichomonas musculus TaxID=1915356 RepID=A0ABR2GW88_9EUKA